ncbi:MAG: histidine phosphatase family protein, partial [Terriglobia bacterium]
MPPLIQPGEETEISTNVENPVEKPEQEFQPGDLAPVWSGPIACASVSHEAENALIECCRSVGNKDVAARRWEVEQEWEMRLYQRGNQNLLPRRGGGWVVPPYSTIYNQQRGRHIFGEETNILAAYGAIITAALGRDIPHVRFEPQNPMDDADVTAADAATRYARLFSHSNDLLTFQDQLVYYLFTGGRAIICTDFILNAQQYGRDTIPAPDPIVPENEDVPTPSVFLLMRHGETALNREDRARGRSESPLDEMGNAQVEQAANFLKGRSISAIISSPVERARESAQMIAQALKLPLTLDDRLASFDLGSLQGQAISDMREMFERAKANPDELMGGTGESWNDFVARIGEVLESLLTVAPGAPPPLVITHDSVIRQMAEMLNGSGGWIPGMTPPGGVAQCCALPDSTYSIHPIFPSTPPLPPSHRTRPRGREVVSCYGKLEAHVPINCAGLDEMPFVQLCREYDVDIVKAMFPEKADKIHPGGGGGGGENELDRIARINVNLALDASYVTGDSMVRDVTVRRTFLRPAAFMRTKPEIRAELFETFPEGCQVIMAGDIFIQARACSMDDHLTLVQAFPGSGQNRLGLGSTMLTAQKRVNNWMNLQDAYFERTVPNRYVDAKLLDAAALNSQSNMPGDYVPVLDPDGAPVNPATAIFVEPTPQPQPTMAQFIQLFMEQVPQLLSGATPTLFGALSNTDTPVGTAAIQRDQALARLTLTWHALTEATSRYFLQAVQLAARCRTSDICGAVGAETIRIELSELKGKCQARPEESANFPESWNQRQFRLTQLLQDANNPLIAPILEHPQ